MGVFIAVPRCQFRIARAATNIGAVVGILIGDIRVGDARRKKWAEGIAGDVKITRACIGSRHIAKGVWYQALKVVIVHPKGGDGINIIGFRGHDRTGQTLVVAIDFTKFNIATLTIDACPLDARN